jgi:hypothetical protein
VSHNSLSGGGHTGASTWRQDGLFGLRPTGGGIGASTGAGTGPAREGVGGSETSEPLLVDGTLGLELGDRLGLLVVDQLEVVLGGTTGWGWHWV